MTNYNERFEEILDNMLSEQVLVHKIGQKPFDEVVASIISTIKELVAEAKPKRKTLAELNGGWRADIAQGFNESLDAYEQNLLKALEEV